MSARPARSQGGRDGQREKGAGDGRHGRAVGQHHRQCAQGEDGVRDEGEEPLKAAALDAGRVVREGGEVFCPVLAAEGREAFLCQQPESAVLVLPHRPLQKTGLRVILQRLCGGDEREDKADKERQPAQAGRARDAGDGVYHLLQDAGDEQVEPRGEEAGEQGEGEVQPIPAEKLRAQLCGATFHGAPLPRARRVRRPQTPR